MGNLFALSIGWPNAIKKILFMGNVLKKETGDRRPELVVERNSIVISHFAFLIPHLSLKNNR
jgi:hypothetical protein